jgi:hypothetical protein
MHNLSLIFPESTSCDKLTVQDGSCYNENFPVENIILEIKPPNECCFISFPLTEGWCSKTFNCEDFGICCSPCSPLPDGNYEIKYSVDPNLTLMVEYNYFRICQLWSQYIKKVCELRLSKCDFSKREYKKELEKLYDIRNMILDSKILAEDCLHVTEAYDLYEQAKTLLNESEGCPSCQ